jgi:hypothetical protein
MTSSYRASLNAANHVFALLVAVLGDESVRKTAVEELTNVIKTSKASNAAELGENVRRALINISQYTYANGLALNVNSSITRVRRDGHI